MITNVFSVFDKKLATYGRPWFELTDASAIRVFSDAVNEKSPNNQWNKHPEDFSLFNLGVFDDSLGSFVTQVAPVQLVTGAAVFDFVNEVRRSTANGVDKEPAEV